MLTLLFDADVMCYRAGFSTEQETNWGESEPSLRGLWTLHSEMDDGVEHVERFVNGVRDELGADRVVMALSSPTNFRKEVMPEYKMHRKAQRKPVSFRGIRQHIEQEYECVERDGLEGDDVLGILATSKNFIEGDRIIVSIDKDMGTIPGKWLNDADARKRMQDEAESSRLADYVVESSVADADYFHMCQTIAGDITDGYAGAPGVGMVNAQRFLDAGCKLVPYTHEFSRGERKGQKEVRWKAGPRASLWQIVVSVFESKGLNEAVAIQNAQVARICRVSDWDFKKGCVKLWHPPK